MADRWRVEIADRAARDIVEVLIWTGERFGAHQRGRYAALIESTLNRLRSGQLAAALRPVASERKGLLRLPVGGRARHQFILRSPAERSLVVLRLLHDAMDVTRHVGPQDEPD